MVKVSARGHVYPEALVIAYSVHETGRREVIGLDTAWSLAVVGTTTFEIP